MPDDPTNSRSPRWMLAAAALALLVATVVWGVSRSLGDLWIGLAAGRDIAAGLLGKPDDWSFVTAGRIWINQNWGSHWLTWLAWSGGGETGLLLLKAALVGAVIALTARLGRERGAAWTPALLAASGVVLAGHSYVDLRPNLLTLVMAPLTLWLIHRSTSGSDLSSARLAGRLGLAVMAVVLWANLHGGFLLGLLMLWLWAAAHAVVPDGSPAPGRGPGRVYFGAAFAATLLCGLVTPFGMANLTETFRIVGATGWHEVREWQPIWVPGTYDSPRGFVVAVVALLVISLLGRRRGATPRGKSRPEPARPRRAADVFEIALTLLTLALAIRARRFAPVALVMMAPLIAVGLHRLTAALGTRPLVAAMAVQLIGVALLLPPLLQTYDPKNPRLRRGDSVFARMHSVNSDFPVTATQFLTTNRIGMDDPAGVRTLAAWEWEGYCRFTAPQLKLLLGGRAQQIYTTSDLETWRRVLGPQVAAEARALGIPLALLHAAPVAHRDQIAALLEAGWVTLFMDPPVMLLVDGRNPAMRGLLDRAEAGALTYPDLRTRLAGTAWVRLGALASGRGSAAEVIAAAASALEAGPDPTWCGLIVSLAGSYPELQSEALLRLEAQLRRLEAIDCGSAPEGERVLLTRRALRNALATLHERRGEAGLAATARAAAEFESGLLDQLARRWSR